MGSTWGLSQNQAASRVIFGSEVTHNVATLTIYKHFQKLACQLPFWTIVKHFDSIYYSTKHFSTRYNDANITHDDFVGGKHPRTATPLTLVKHAARVDILRRFTNSKMLIETVTSGPQFGLDQNQFLGFWALLVIFSS